VVHPHPRYVEGVWRMVTAGEGPVWVWHAAGGGLPSSRWGFAAGCNLCSFGVRGRGRCGGSKFGLPTGPPAPLLSTYVLSCNRGVRVPDSDFPGERMDGGQHVARNLISRVLCT